MLAIAARYERGSPAWGSISSPSRVRPTAKATTITPQKPAARSRRPSSRWPSPGTSHASSMSTGRGRRCPRRVSRGPPPSGTLHLQRLSELGAGLVELLGEHAHFGVDRHEAGVAAPPRHDVQVQVIGNPGPGRLAEVEPQVEPVWLVGPL